MDISSRTANHVLYGYFCNPWSKFITYWKSVHQMGQLKSLILMFFDLDPLLPLSIPLMQKKKKKKVSIGSEWYEQKNLMTSILMTLTITFMTSILMTSILMTSILITSILMTSILKRWLRKSQESVWYQMRHVGKTFRFCRKRINPSNMSKWNK